MAGHAGHTVSTCTAPDLLDLALWVGKAFVRKGAPLEQES